MDQRRIYRSRRRGRIVTYILVAVAAVLGAGLAYEIVGLPTVEALAPSPEGFVRDPSPTIVVRVRGLDKLSDLRVSLDGRDVSAKATRDGDRLSIAAGSLPDGVHVMRLRADSSNLLRRRLDERWHFTVDTQAPALKLDPDVADGSISTSPAVLSGRTEPDARVDAVAGAVTASATAGSTGRFELRLTVPEGPVDIALTATDRAGNVDGTQLSAYVDAAPPILAVDDVKTTVHRATFSLAITATDTLRPPRLAAQLDGEAAKLRGDPAAAILRLTDLAQGKHVVIVTASDKGGNKVVERRTFVVDSTERFGAAALWPGAKGRDVRDLQRVLADRGVFDGQPTGFYSSDTAAAVKEFQDIVGLEPDGRVGEETLIALSRRIVIDLSQLRLYLYDGAQLIHSYPIAAGQPAYPTPTGSYRVASKVIDPTWYPPNSDWAKNATPIPPGVENPLGTRWIGTTAPGVGIHGTPDDASIGTHASHGCIRMHIPDVEQLFPHVVIGMRVLIQP